MHVQRELTQIAVKSESLTHKIELWVNFLYLLVPIECILNPFFYRVYRR